MGSVKPFHMELYLLFSTSTENVQNDNDFTKNAQSLGENGFSTKLSVR